MNPAVALTGAGLATSLVGSAAYLRDIAAGTTVPHRGAWTTWSAVAVTAAAAHGASGGRLSLLVLGVQALTTIAVWVMSWFRGTGGVDRTNLVLLAVTGLGLAGWLALSDPLTASLCAVVADGSGLLAIVPKVWRDPGSETAATYLLAAVSGLCALVPARDLALAGTLFPAYYLVGNLAVGLLIARRAVIVV